MFLKKHGRTQLFYLFCINKTSNRFFTTLKMRVRISILISLFILLVFSSTLWGAIPTHSIRFADSSALTNDSIASDSLLSSTQAIGERIVEQALCYIGARYGRGQDGPNCFDCSGFTRFIYGKEDIPIQRTSRMQFREGTPIDSINKLQKGDLVFFGGRKKPKSVGHVGIVTDVASDGSHFEFIHASRTGVTVTRSDSVYYKKRYLGARRIIER